MTRAQFISRHGDKRMYLLTDVNPYQQMYEGDHTARHHAFEEVLKLDGKLVQDVIDWLAPREPKIQRTKTKDSPHGWLEVFLAHKPPLIEFRYSR